MSFWGLARGLEASKVSVSSRQELGFSKRGVSSQSPRSELFGACSRPRGVESQRFVETRAGFFEARGLEPEAGTQRDSAATRVQAARKAMYRVFELI